MKSLSKQLLLDILLMSSVWYCGLALRVPHRHPPSLRDTVAVL